MSLSASVLAGSGWMVGLRWVNRFIGLISVAITARLLSPADFGLVAMATLVVGLADVWMQWGLDNALVQARDPQRDMFDTAWTIRLLQGLFVAVLVAALAPLAAAYFRDPRVELVMFALAPGVALVGASNIGVVMFRKEMDFRREFMLQFGTRITQVAVGIVAAYLLRSSWALVIGLLTGYAAGFALSYLMHPFRPRWSLASWRALWSFSAWTLVGNLSYFAETRADELIVGRIGSARDMGLYSTASDLGQSVSLELAAPIGRVLFPAFAKMQDDRERLAAGFVRAFEALAMVIVPAGVGLALVAEDAVAVLLGSQWAEAAALVGVLAIYGVLRSASAPITSLFLAAGRVELSAALTWFGFTMFLVFALPMAHLAGVLGIAWAKVLAALMTFAFALVNLKKVAPIRPAALLGALPRIGLGIAAMAGAVRAISTIDVGPGVSLLAKATAGATVYAIVIFTLWVIRGRPDGIERLAAEFVTRARRRSS
jgi:O-antigen/teichoic acid export membrane protein